MRLTLLYCLLAGATCLGADSKNLHVPVADIHAPADLEVTLWAKSPMLRNPTNMDTDEAGRIWVAEGVNYRGRQGTRPAGDRIVVLEDTDGDGKCDSSHTFVQEPGLIAPMGVAVIDNVVYVSQPPDLLAYTDVNRDLKFDPSVDRREVILTGFNAINHDHGLHSVTAGPDGTVMIRRPLAPEDLEAIPEDAPLGPGLFASQDWDVFDSDGRYLGLVTLPDRFEPMKVVGRSIYGTDRDEFDVQYVVRLAVEIL